MKKEASYIKEYILGRKITINYNIQEILMLDNKFIKPKSKRRLRKINEEIKEILEEPLKDLEDNKRKEITQEILKENNKYYR